MSHPALVRRSLAAVLFGASVAFGLTACASAPEASAPYATLAPGWQDHARSLIYDGPGLSPGHNSWMVSGLLPKGTYQVIARDAGGARVIDGHRLVYDGNPATKVYLQIPMNSGDLALLEEKFILGTPPR